VEMVVAMSAGVSWSACSPARTFAGLATVEDEADGVAEDVTCSAPEWDAAADVVAT
jgi:hypothetical protein